MDRLGAAEVGLCIPISTVNSAKCKHVNHLFCKHGCCTGSQVVFHACCGREFCSCMARFPRAPQRDQKVTPFLFLHFCFFFLFLSGEGIQTRSQLLYFSVCKHGAYIGFQPPLPWAYFTYELMHGQLNHAALPRNTSMH